MIVSENAAESFGQFHGARILLLDHRSQFIRGFYESLQHQGYTVRLVFNTPDALNGSRQWKPDLIGVVCGSSFPGLADVCRHLRESSRAPILVLSTEVRESVILASFEAGADDYVTIPRSLAEITARIRSQLRRGADPRLIDRRAS